MDWRTIARPVLVLAAGYMVFSVLYGLKTPRPAEAQQTVEQTTPGCTASQISIEKFSPAVYDDCTTMKCPALKLTGWIVNKCMISVRAKVRITALAKDNSVVDTVTAYPGAVPEIAAGQSVPFDLGPLMRYRETMRGFTAEAVVISP